HLQEVWRAPSTCLDACESHFSKHLDFGLVGEAVEKRLILPAHHDEPVRLEFGEVLRNGGGGDPENVAEIANANLAELFEKVEEPQSRRLGHDVQDRRSFVEVGRELHRLLPALNEIATRFGWYATDRHSLSPHSIAAAHGYRATIGTPIAAERPFDPRDG